MYSHFIKPLTLVLTLLALPITPLAQKAKDQDEKPTLTPKQIAEIRKSVKPVSGKAFTITPTDKPYRFHIFLSDEERRSVSNMFLTNQVIVFHAVVTEALKFAKTDEAAGVGKPITTRFMDSNEPEFFVDVTKKDLESRFFITLQGMKMGEKLTVDGGAIKRGEDRSEHKGIFFDLVKRLEEIKNTPSDQ